MSSPLLQVENLKAGFVQGGQMTKAVGGVSFAIERGETFALVGESGSGKSVTALSVLRLLPQNGRILDGKVTLKGRNLFALPEMAMSSVRGRRIGIVFQDPQSSLNPVMSIGQQVGEVLRLHKRLNGGALKARVIELLGLVGLPRPERHFAEYPHQLSGGMRQRVMIAIALAGEPDLLIADEPTTALDVTVQAQILELLKRLQRETGMALWLITHDLGIVHDLADRIAVMRNGLIVEEARRDDFFRQPEHPYSRQLLDALPRLSDCVGREPVAQDRRSLLEVSDFKVHYPIRKGLFQRVVGHVRAVDGVSFSLRAGETLALVGESGCGKTTLGKGILNLIDSSGGRVEFDGTDITAARGEQRRMLCRAMQIVFQDPYAAMNPRMIVGDIIEEGMKAVMPQLSAGQRRRRVESLLESVGLSPESRLRYPHEFSGGQRQRICIARALAVEPRLIVCDEPTSALDVSVQFQILELLKDLQKKEKLSYLFITHDLGVVADIAHRVAVMYRGRIVETGPTEQVLLRPEHPYTRSLLEALPGLRKAS
ncbi:MULTISPECIES: ABC transporter ATP-binding protein [Methylococcus]|uniref:Dipeptide ABC transporter ATP-binding protein n=1 Tax=Methylococcus capsulatus TaxID=414 RepID=A0ABZ2F344_METCP|nr:MULTISPECIES: dipeptide ABC transporter ATP-binding protein [Methylococcus]MDF9391929.1 ABC transporter ATP-binding protein [Methylococcus capsulatus]